MDTDLFALRSFVRLADELNFARTAAALHISAPKLTRVIQTLELQVGTQLVARSTHGASLTAAGVEFLSSASRMVAEADWVGRRFGKRRIAASATFVVGCLAGSLYEPLPQRVRAARKAHAKLQIRLVEVDESTLHRQVLDGSLDMGFLYSPEPDDLIESRVVSRRGQWVAMSPDHPLARRKQLSLKDLRPHTLILPDEKVAPRLHRWYRQFLDLEDRRDLSYIGANQIHVALGLCAAGEGLCVVAEPLRRVRSDDLLYVPLQDAPRTELAAIWRRDSPVRQVAQFIASGW
jgi:DNA-binding transcriptional LysR family regulator